MHARILSHVVTIYLDDCVLHTRQGYLQGCFGSQFQKCGSTHQSLAGRYDELNLDKGLTNTTFVIPVMILADQKSYQECHACWWLKLFIK